MMNEIILLYLCFWYFMVAGKTFTTSIFALTFKSTLYLKIYEETEFDLIVTHEL